MARDDEHDEQDPADEQALEQAALAAGVGGTESAGAVRDVHPGQTTAKGPARFARFLKASWAELQRVQWPDRRQVGQATAVVLGFVVVAGAYLGIADVVAEELVDFVL